VETVSHLLLDQWFRGNRTKLATISQLKLNAWSISLLEIEMFIRMKKLSR